MCARSVFVILVIWKGTSVLNISSLSQSSVNTYIYITYSTNQTNFYSRFCVSRVLHHISYINFLVSRKFPQTALHERARKERENNALKNHLSLRETSRRRASWILVVVVVVIIFHRFIKHNAKEKHQREIYSPRSAFDSPNKERKKEICSSVVDGRTRMSMSITLQN